MSANDFVPIRVCTLRGGLAIDFDAYISVGEKFILYCRQGESFEGEQLIRLKKKKLKKMYIKSDQENQYRTYIMESIETAFSNDPETPLESRCEVIQGAQQAAAEEIIDSPESPEAYEFAKMGAERYVDFLLKENDSLKNILSIENPDQNIAQHGVSVATLAVAMAGKLEITDVQKLSLLSVGCFIHDLGHIDSDYDYTTPRSEMSTDVLKEYINHPTRCAEKIVQYGHFDKEVIDIVMQHEELINGSGFPKGLLERDTLDLALIASTANTFDRLVTFQGKTPAEAMKIMQIDSLGLHPLDHIKALSKTLKERGVI